MNIGVFSTLIASLFGGLSSVVQKKIAVGYQDNRLALVFQYIAIAFFVLLLGGIRAIWQGTPYIPTLSSLGIWSVIGVGIIGYLGIAMLYKALDHMSAGIALVIANTCTFIMYFMNLWLYPGQEAFSITKIIIAIAFFVIIVIFLLDQDKAKGSKPTKKNHINKYLFYPIVTAFCWAIYFTANGYFVKSGMMNPVQSGMVTETIILVIALLWFLLGRYNQTATEKRVNPISIPNKKYIGLFLLIGLFNTLNAYLTYYGYQMISANMVNVIKLLSVPITAFGAWLFLKDALTRKQTILLVIAIALMTGFLLV